VEFPSFAGLLLNDSGFVFFWKDTPLFLPSRGDIPLSLPSRGDACVAQATQKEKEVIFKAFFQTFCPSSCMVFK
jgi:hypothetical protein